MKKFTRISLIIIAAIGGVGVLLCIIASFMGAGYGTLRQMARNGELDSGNWHIGPYGIYYSEYNDEWAGVWLDDMFDVDDVSDVSDVSDEEPGNLESGAAGTGEQAGYAVADIRNLDVDIDAATVIFKEGTDAERIVVTRYNCKEKYFDSRMDGDTLEIEYDIERHYSYHNYSPKIVIEIPAGMSFGKIELDMGATDTDFEMTDVTCEKLTLDVGAGDVTANKFNVTDKMEVNLGAGSLKIQDGTYGNIRLKCGVGEFSMKGTVTGDVDADCGMGSMDIQLSGNESNYNYDLSCGLGELSVNGTSYSSISGSQRITNQGAIGTVKLSCGMGDVSLTVE